LLIILAPSKTMNFKKEWISEKNAKDPFFPEKTALLVERLKDFDLEGIMSLMKVSRKIAEENIIRFENFSFGVNEDKQRVAITALKGDTYKGLDASSFDRTELLWAEDNIRILSGLYGILSPLTLIEPYRLEMALKIDLDGVIRISDFWKEAVTSELNRLLSKRKEKIIIDCASAEYMASVDKHKINGRIINIVFYENHKGTLKNIAIFSKKARGMMAHFIVKNQIGNPQRIKEFNAEGYHFDSSLSNEEEYIFVRDSRFD